MAGIGPREIAAAVKTLASGNLARYSSTRPSLVSAFEAELASHMGVRHALAVNSGTNALICALVAAGVGPGDEVLVPAYTWVSTAAAPLAVGAVPILVEVDQTLTIDLQDMERKLTPQTKAVIPVHMINLVCDMDALVAFGHQHNLTVIEDACQAIGATYKGQRVGSIGDLGVFSFNQHKNLNSGEGGAVLTNSDRDYGRAEMFHDVGSYERGYRSTYDGPVFPGINARMPELSAAILRPQLRRLDKQLATRERRRAMVLDKVNSLGRADITESPHHDVEHAIGVALLFDTVEAARVFGETRGVRRLADTGRHNYTNWVSIRSMAYHHDDLDPHRFTQATPDYSETSCPQTLDMLERTCTVELAPELPDAAFKLLLTRLGQQR